MKIIYYILVIIFIQSCSFDNKSGIWKNSSDESNKVNKNFKEFKKVVLENEILFDKTVKLNEEFKFFLTPPYSANIWNDPFYGESNINDNFSYSDKNQLILQSSKLSRKKLDGNIDYWYDGMHTTKKGSKAIADLITPELISYFDN